MTFRDYRPGQAFDSLTPYAALFLAAGAELYLVGETLFRLGIGFGPVPARLAAAMVALATLPIGLASASLQLTALLVVLLAAILIRPRRAIVRS